MGRQIRFFLCSSMREAIESEASRIGARLVDSHSSDASAIQFSTPYSPDSLEGRLWTEASDAKHYNALCRAIKKNSVYDRDAGVWVKCASKAAFDTYYAEKQRALSELVARNRKYAIEVLAAKLTIDKSQ
jgi:hypothetical protein